MYLHKVERTIDEDESYIIKFETEKEAERAIETLRWAIFRHCPVEESGGDYDHHRP